MRSDDSPASEQPEELQVPEVESTFRLGLTKAHGEEADPAVELGDHGDASSSRLQSLSKSKTGVRYVLKGEVGRGGMGVILKVFDKDLRRNLAMKVMLGKTSAESGETTAVDPAMLSRFLEEAQVTSQLDHPGVVPVHELGVDSEGRVYFTMRLVRGQTLKEIFDNVQAGAEGWNQVRALGVLMKVCEAMAYAHDKGVIHRDLKPANVMVGKYGEVYVMDWGLARVEGREDTRDIRLEPSVESLSEVRTDRREERDSDIDSPLVTMDGAVVGTPAYMSREQALGQAERVDRRSDVYSVGAMLYQLLTGCVPYVPLGARMSGRTIHMRVIDGPPKPVREVSQSLTPVELEAICEKAMSREPEDRYTDMGDLSDDLRAYIEGRVVRAHRTGAVIELKKWVARNMALAGTVAAGILVLLAGLVTSLLLKTRSDTNYALAEGRLQEAVTARKLAKENLTLAEKRHAESERRSYTAFLLAAEAARKEGNNAEARRLHQLCPEEYRGWEWGHLGLQLDRSSRVFEMHASGVRVVAASSDGQRIVSFDFDDVVRVWNLDTGESLALETIENPGPANGKFLPPMGLLFAAFREDGRSGVVVTGYGTTPLPNHRGYQQPTPRPSRVGPGGGGGGRWRDSTFAWVTWDAESGAIVSKQGNKRGRALGLSPRARLIVYWDVGRPDDAESLRSGSKDIVSTHLLDTDTGENVLLQGSTRTLAPPLYWDLTKARRFCFSSDGHHIASGSDGTLRIWDAENGEVLHALGLPEREVSALALSPSGALVAFLSNDGTLQVCDVEAGKPPLVLEGHTGVVTSAGFSPDGRRIVSTSRDSTLRLWDAETGAALDVLNGHGSWVEAAVFTHDGDQIVSGSLDGDLRIWEGGAAGSEHVVGAPTSLGWGGDLDSAELLDAVALSADCRRVVSAEKPRSTEWNSSAYVWPELRVWDLESGEVLQVLEGHTWGVGALAFSADGRRIVSGSDDQTVRIWDAEDGRCLRVFRGHGGSVYSVAISPDGQKIVSSSENGHVRLIDTSTAEEIRDFKMPGSTAHSLAFSPDGEDIAAGGEKNVLVWSVSADAPARVLPHARTVGAVAFSPDGQRLVSGSWDHKVRIWNLESDLLVTELEGHTNAVKSVMFSKDGSRILSSGDMLRVWDAETFETLYVLDESEAMAIGFDGKRILAAARDGTVRTWESDLVVSARLGHARRELREMAANLEPLWFKYHSVDEVVLAFERSHDTSLPRARVSTVARWQAGVRDLHLIEDLFGEIFLEEGDVTVDGLARALGTRSELPVRVTKRARELVARLTPETLSPGALSQRAWEVVAPDATGEGDRAVALTYAREAVSRSPANASYRRTLSWALFANRFYDEAVMASEKALDLAPETEKEAYGGELGRLLDMIED